MNLSASIRAIILCAAAVPIVAVASSHREAPMIAGTPRVDGTDFYMFRSYERTRSPYITFLANYVPLQDPGGGPNFFNLDTNAVYTIHVDNDGDAFDDISFNFRFANTYKNLSVNAGGKKIAVPLINIGQIGLLGTNANVTQTYTIEVNRNGQTALAQNVSKGGTEFAKPLDNIGEKSIPDYAGYSSHFMFEVGIPGCPTPGRVFVGQRKEGFVVNIGPVFDLVNLNPVQARDASSNALSGKNVTSIALEVPISCLVSKGDPVIGAYTSAAYVTQGSSGGEQRVSRLGMPLVNELVIGLPDKDKFNASKPSNDAQFLDYVTNPSLPVLLNALFGSAALVPETPRSDLVAAFLTGVKGINQPVKVTPGEMLRLNTSTPPTPLAQQNDLGVLGGDLAGFPNGRRPYDDVVDITLRVAEGALCGAIGNCGSQKADPNNGTPYTDGARASGPDTEHVRVTGKIKAGDTYLSFFPYLNTPLPGSPNALNGVDGLPPG